MLKKIENNFKINQIHRDQTKTTNISKKFVFDILQPNPTDFLPYALNFFVAFSFSMLSGVFGTFKFIGKDLV